MTFNLDRFLLDAKTRIGKLNFAQVQGLTFLLTFINKDPEWKMLRQVAYFLATVRWETANTYLPIKERRANSRTQPSLYKQQSLYWKGGYYGRGYIQLTHPANYKTMGKRLTGMPIMNDKFEVIGAVGPLSFLREPDLVMQPHLSYAIAAIGMREGLFTGRKLGQYIKEGEAPDYRSARKVINGLDHNQDIAAYAETFELLLRASLIEEPK